MKIKEEGATNKKTVFWTLILLLMLATCLQPRKSLQTQNSNRATPFRFATSPFASTAIHHSGLPKADEILFKTYPGYLPEAIVDEFCAGETDWIGGPSRKDLYDEAVAAGHKISPMDPTAWFDFVTINCRDYKETSGEPNSPLNDSRFRVALSYIYGMDDKEDDVSDDFRYGSSARALGNPLPPAQEPWYDETVQMPNTNWSMAWDILEAAGYYVNTTENWLYCNEVKTRNMTLLHWGNCGSWDEGAAADFVRAFNEFVTTYLSLDGPTITPSMTGTVIDELKVYHDFDFISIGLSNRGRYADWTYDLLHSSNIGSQKWNFMGIVDPEFDDWAETILTSLNVTEVIDAASKLQEKFVCELMPWFPIQSGYRFCTVAREAGPPVGRGELMNVVSMPNLGPMNDWSWMTVHWNYSWPGGTVTAGLGDEPHSLNPYDEDTVYGWEIIGRALLTGETGLLGVNPVTLMNMPFVATDWEASHLTSMPELNIVNGCRVTFWLRQDVIWHDGRPVTAHDCVANMKFLRENEPGRYRDTGKHLVYEEADGPYKFSVYFNESSLYYPYHVAETALLAPKHIIEEVEGYWLDWNPCFTAYEDLGIGPPPEDYPFLKQLVGCGPFVFDYYNRDLNRGRVTRFNDFFVNAPVIGSIVGEWRISPEASYSYVPLVQNVAAMETSENGTFTDVTVDVRIYEDEVLACEVDGLRLEVWNYTYMDTYTMEDVSSGLHTIIIEVYDHNDSSLLHTYTHTFVVTIKEDITTCNGEVMDFGVNMRDISRVAKAFCSCPDHPRWDSICDMNKDYEVDMRDIGRVSRKYGWHY